MSPESLFMLLFARLQTALSTRLFRRAPDTLSRAELDRMSKRIILPSLPVTDEELARAAFQDRGQKLARQEDWLTLAREIAQADAARTGTPGGETAAMLLAYGARGDVVAAAEDALHDGKPPVQDGLAALEEIATEAAETADGPNAYPCALIVALAHMDVGLAWQAAPRSRALGDTPDRARQSHHHFTRASELLAPFCAKTLGAPSLAAAQCALLAGQMVTERQVADKYEALVRLDQASPRHLRALGRALLPECGGSHAGLDLEARRMVALTRAHWGAGAYAWVYLDAMSLDPGCVARLDPVFFGDALRDVLSRCPDQHVANLLSACLAAALRDETIAPDIRKELTALLEWALANHLRELHPLVWTQALHRPDTGVALPSRGALLRLGRRAALGTIAQVFADKLADGSSIAFSPAGMYRLPNI